MSSSTTLTQSGRFRGLDFIGGMDDSTDSEIESSSSVEARDKNDSADTDSQSTDSIDVFMLDDCDVSAKPKRPTLVTDFATPINHDGLSMSRSSSIPISSSSRPQNRRQGPPQLDFIDATPIATRPGTTAKQNKSKHKKTNGSKKANKNNNGRPSRAITPIPLTNGDEPNLSNHRFPKRDISVSTTAASSPFLQPTSRTSSITTGISALRQKFNDIRLQRTSSNAGSVSSARPMSSGVSSVTSRSQSPAEQPQMESYEVPLGHDFVSNDADVQQSDPLSPLMHVMHRHMTAEDFDVKKCLGKGSFGTVYLVEQKATGKLFAQKTFRKASLTVTKSLVDQTRTERAILESINRHPFIVNLYYAFQDQEKLYLILEYAQGGELFTQLASQHIFPEDTAAFYMAEIIVALNYLHENGIVYRDLKPENCLLDAQGHLLLTDFGLSKETLPEEAHQCRSILGTWEYMAPEVIQGLCYDRTVDWWSLGAICCDFLTGNPPFKAANRAKLQQKIIKDQVKFPFFVSPDAKDLMTRLLRKDPRQRLGSNMPKDLKTIKKHRFFRKLDWDKLERRELTPPIDPLVTDPAQAENFAKEFTELALSPKLESFPAPISSMDLDNDPSNEFYGFSFVGSKSLFKSEGFLGTAMQQEQDAIMETEHCE